MPPCAETGDTEHELRERAQQMVDFHIHMQASSNAGTGTDAAAATPRFPEHGAYAQVSIRELLKLVNHLTW